MKTIILVLTILTLLPILQSRCFAQLRIEVIGAEACEGSGPRPTYDTCVKFRVTNIAKHPIQLAGTNYNDIKEYATENGIVLDPTPFRPLFVQVNFDSISGKWKYPTNGGKPPEWKHLAAANNDRQLLPPGRILEFDNVMSSELEGDRPFKLALFVFVSGAKKPIQVLSDELVFGKGGS